MYMECAACNSDGDIELPAADDAFGFLACPTCGAVIATLDVSECQQDVEVLVAAKMELQRTGRIGTRKQSTHQTDAEISRDGIAAELAAELLLAPRRRERYWAAAKVGGGNRGRDFSAELTGLDKPTEVKQTKYRTATAGYLLIRPPRMTPGRMVAEYIDDSYYLLLHGNGFRYTVLGWADRGRVIREGRLNPVPHGASQRECWGIHWSKLLPLESLAERFTANS